MEHKKRSNVWTFIGYPNDSLPDNYLSIIQNWHIPCLVSPIHDKDINADDTEKKKHIHFMLYFGKGANKSYDQVLFYTKSLNATIPQIVNSVNAMVRYFVHYDNPEKFQYKKSDLICLSGFDIGDSFESYSNDEKIYERIEELINDFQVYNFSILVQLLKSMHMNIELSFLRRHTLYFREILNGNYQRAMKSVD